MEGEREAYRYANRRRIRVSGVSDCCASGGEGRVHIGHLLETGGLRRVYLRGQEEIRKRMLLHAVAFHLGLFMRKRKRSL